MRWSYFVAQANLEIMILLPLLPWGWYTKRVPIMLSAKKSLLTSKNYWSEYLQPSADLFSLYV